MHLGSLIPNPNPNFTFPPYPSFSTAVIGVPASRRLPMAGLFNPYLRAVRSETALSEENRPQTMIEYLGKTRAVSDDLTILISHIEYACKRIAALVASPFSSAIGRRPADGDVTLSSSSGRDAPKPLDVVSVLFVFLLLNSVALLLSVIIG